jgi:hypothetical protein
MDREEERRGMTIGEPNKSDGKIIKENGRNEIKI